MVYGIRRRGGWQEKADDMSDGTWRMMSVQLSALCPTRLKLTFPTGSWCLVSSRRGVNKPEERETCSHLMLPHGCMHNHTTFSPWVYKVLTKSRLAKWSEKIMKIWTDSVTQRRMELSTRERGAIAQQWTQFQDWESAQSEIFSPSACLCSRGERQNWDRSLPPPDCLRLSLSLCVCVGCLCCVHFLLAKSESDCGTSAGTGWWKWKEGRNSTAPRLLFCWILWERKRTSEREERKLRAFRECRRRNGERKLAPGPFLLSLRWSHFLPAFSLPPLRDTGQARERKEVVVVVMVVSLRLLHLLSLEKRRVWQGRRRARDLAKRSKIPAIRDNQTGGHSSKHFCPETIPELSICSNSKFRWVTGSSIIVIRVSRLSPSFWTWCCLYSIH